MSLKSKHCARKYESVILIGIFHILESRELTSGAATLSRLMPSDPDGCGVIFGRLILVTRR